MKPPPNKTTTSRQDRGQSMSEFAYVLPIYILLFFGGLQLFGMAFQQMGMSNLSYKASRAAYVSNNLPLGGESSEPWSEIIDKTIQEKSFLKGLQGNLQGAVSQAACEGEQIFYVDISGKQAILNFNLITKIGPEIMRARLPVYAPHKGLPQRK